MPNMLNEEQMAQLGALLEQEDAANPAPIEEEPEMEEAETPDEVDTVNENAAEIGEGDGEAADTPAQPDPNAGANPQANAFQLPEGFTDVNQLVTAYNELLGQSNRRGDEMQALRDLNGQLVAIAEALGYTKDIGSVDLSVDEGLKDTDPNAYMQQQVRKEIADQLKPMIEAQQKNLRQRLIDDSWKGYARDHGDVAEMMDDIKAIIGEMPELADNEHGMEVAHHMARSRKYVPESKMMEDDGFIKRAAANPKIKEMVIADYLKEVSKGGESAPATVGGGGRAVPTKKKELTMDEAHREARKLWGA